MINEALQEQAALYVTGAMSAEERKAFEQTLQSDSALAGLVADLQQTMSALAASGSQPPLRPGLKAELMGRLGTPVTAVLPFPVPAQSPALSSRIAWFPWALAACLTLLCFVLWRGHQAASHARAITEARLAAAEELSRALADDKEQLLVGNRTLPALTQQLAAAQTRLASFSNQTASLKMQAASAVELRRDLETINKRADELGGLVQSLTTQVAALSKLDPLNQMRISVLPSLLETDPGTFGVTVWDAEQQRGLLVTEKLTELPPDKEYQLWLIDPRYPNPVSAGLFVVDAKGKVEFTFKPEQPVTNIDKFAVTIERKGGVPKPEGRMVLLSR